MNCQFSRVADNVRGVTCNCAEGGARAEECFKVGALINTTVSIAQVCPSGTEQIQELNPFGSLIAGVSSSRRERESISINYIDFMDLLQSDFATLNGECVEIELSFVPVSQFRTRQRVK